MASTAVAAALFDPFGDPSRVYFGTDTVAPAPPFDTPVKVAVFGDSPGMTLLLNKPTGLGRYLHTTDATIEGCGIMLNRVSSRSGERRNLDDACPN